MDRFGACARWGIFSAFAALLLLTLGFDGNPPTFTIKGKLPSKYTAVGLFSGYGDLTPNKLGRIADGSYSIAVDVTEDLDHLSDRFGTFYRADMIFWNDVDGDSRRAKGESTSLCHFLIWEPGRTHVALVVVNGDEEHAIRSTPFAFNPR